jgi:YVTN family beta-propeller protein
MKSLISIISFITLFTIQLFSQVEIPVFDRMSGQWVGTYESNGNKIQEVVYMMWIMNHNFFEIRTHGTGVDNKEIDYGEIDHFTLDNEGKLIGTCFGRNGINYMLDFKGIFDENKVELKGKNEAVKNSVYFELKDNQLTREGQFTSKGKKTINTEIVYSNVRSDYLIALLKTNYDKIGEPGLAYVCQLTESFVTVFDTKTNKLLGKIPSGKGTGNICFSPDRKNGYISNYQSGNLTVFDRKTNETITTVAAGMNPTFLLPVNNYVLISHQSTDGLWVLDCTNNTITKKLSEGTGPLYLIEKENKIYQPQIFTPYLFIIDPEKLEIINRFQIGGRPMDMTFIQDQRFGYMVNFDFNEVTKFDTKTDSIVAHIKDVKNPRGIAASPDGKLVYVTNPVEGEVYVIDTRTDSVTAVIGGFQMPVYAAFTADGKYAYVLNQSAGTISVIDTGTNKIIQTIGVGNNPISILIDNG